MHSNDCGYWKLYSIALQISKIVCATPRSIVCNLLCIMHTCSIQCTCHACLHEVRPFAANRLEYIMLLNLFKILSSNSFLFYSHFVFSFILYRRSRIKLLTITNYIIYPQLHCIYHGPKPCVETCFIQCLLNLNITEAFIIVW